jgi:hypothetical protein
MMADHRSAGSQGPEGAATRRRPRGCRRARRRCRARCRSLRGRFRDASHGAQRREPFEQVRGVASDPGLGREVHHLDELAEDVDLPLVRGRVADPHGCRPAIAGQPRDVPSVEVARAVEPVHDLDMLGRSRDCAQYPIAPGLGLGLAARIEQRRDRESHVAQPAVAIVPAHLAGRHLGERGGRRSTSAADSPSPIIA